MALGVHQIDSYIEQNNVLMEDFDRKTYLSFFPPLKVRFRILRRAAIYIYINVRQDISDLESKI